MSEPAPFYHDIADGPAEADAIWVTASDGVRLRLAIWPGGAKGTVLLFPGRTEYLEKYGRAAGALADLGFATIAIDWRGQGLADRLTDNPMLGFVDRFDDYQLDVAELLATAQERGLPQPYYLVAHSMGGAIGLRALIRGLPVKAVVFSAPMWGISISPAMRPLAWVLSSVGRWVWGGHQLTPGTSAQTYVMEAPFEDNMLTRDPDMYAYMQSQLAAHPELALGGPSLHWLYEALTESWRTEREPAPALPCLTFLGSNERVVDVPPIHARMRDWPGGRLELIENAEHEVMMETPAVRDRVFAEMAAHFSAHP
ncbi:MAG: alpha/beta hydrolase [Rhodobacter sp.]|nr:alpha/beta hydrolase [Rhodobacter sp.]